MVCVVIVESPAKCKKIEGFLGKGYKCVASFGHIRHLSQIRDGFTPVFTLLPGKAKYIRKLKAQVKKADEVILATDDDREGEAIAWHLCIYLNLPVQSTKRIIFHEITKTALLHAIQHPTYIDMDKVQAQQTRQILDRLIGFTVSPLLWKQFYHGGPNKTGLSAGRCQTPALRLVYDNYQEILKAPGRQVYDTKGHFMGWSEPFLLNHTYTCKEEIIRFLKTNIGFSHTMLPPKKPTLRSKKAPFPLTTSTLQQKASNLLHFSPKRTMRLAQTLYESGLITYMRTDSAKYSKECIKKVKVFILKRWPVTTDYFRKNMAAIMVGGKSKKHTHAQEAHEAIRPTDITKETVTVANIGAAERKLYQMIWCHTVESCMSDALINHITACIRAPQQHEFHCKAKQVVFPGWLIVQGYEKENALYHHIQNMNGDEKMIYRNIYSMFNMKDLKRHYTEARLVQMLETKGIGRPSTFSSLVDKIQMRRYVSKTDVPGRVLSCTDYELIDTTLSTITQERCFGKETNKLVLQSLGLMVIKFLIQHLGPLFRYDYTKQMEDRLDLISKGEQDGYTVCNDCNTELETCVGSIKSERQQIQVDPCHTYMVARYGPVLKYEKDGKVEFKPVKKNIDLDRLKKGGYTVDELLEKKSAFSERQLGSFKNQDVILKKGRYGLYIACGKKNYSVKGIKKSNHAIKLEDVLDILLGKKSSGSTILLTLHEHASVRSGKYGPYIYYKTSTMKKPRFLTLKGIKWKDYTARGLWTWAKSEYSL